MTPFDPRLPVIAAAARVYPYHVYHVFHSWKQYGANFNATMYSAFSGLEERHVARILTALEAHGVVPKAKATSTNGTRLSPDFKAPQAWLDFAIEERRWTPDDAAAEAEVFRDFWVSKPGAHACKLDWLATWRNWVRRSRRPDGDYRPPAAHTLLSSREQTERAIALYERLGRTVEAEDLRAQLAKSVNVLPFPSDRAKLAISGG